METSLDAGRPLTRGARLRGRTWIPGKGPGADIEPAILIGEALGIEDGRRLPQRLTRGGTTPAGFASARRFCSASRTAARPSTVSKIAALTRPSPPPRLRRRPALLNNAPEPRKPFRRTPGPFDSCKREGDRLASSTINRSGVSIWPAPLFASPAPSGARPATLEANAPSPKRQRSPSPSTPPPMR